MKKVLCMDEKNTNVFDLDRVVLVTLPKSLLKYKTFCYIVQSTSRVMLSKHPANLPRQTITQLMLYELVFF